jgi:hypothetical protein
VQERGHVLKNKGGGFEFLDYAQEIGKKKVAFVRGVPLPHGAKALAGRSADQDLDLSGTDFEIFQNPGPGHSGKVSTVVGGVRKVTFVRVKCSLVEVDGTCEAESGASGAEAHSSAATEEVNSRGFVRQSVKLRGKKRGPLSSAASTDDTSSWRHFH